MGGVKTVLKQTVVDNQLILELPAQPYKQAILEVLKKSDEKYGGYISIELKQPYKPRTTGKDSQNNLVWALITVIANEMGEDTDYVENLIKIKATSKGYPYKIIEGQMCPASMTKINTVECSYLIDTCYEMCSFLGIVLEPELTRQEPVIDEKANAETMKALGLEYETEENYQGDIF